MKSGGILVAVDGSAQADKALDSAAELAKALDTTLVILHVASPDMKDQERRELENLERMEHNERTMRYFEKPRVTS